MGLLHHHHHRHPHIAWTIWICVRMKKRGALFTVLHCPAWIGYSPASNRLLLNGDNDSNDSDYPPNTIASVWHTGTHTNTWCGRCCTWSEWEIWWVSEWARECQLKSVLIHSSVFVIYWLSNDYSKGQQREWLLIMFFPWKTRLPLQERFSNNNFIILVKSRSRSGSPLRFSPLIKMALLLGKSSLFLSFPIYKWPSALVFSLFFSFLITLLILIISTAWAPSAPSIYIEPVSSTFRPLLHPAHFSAIFVVSSNNFINLFRLRCCHCCYCCCCCCWTGKVLAQSFLIKKPSLLFLFARILIAAEVSVNECVPMSVAFALFAVIIIKTKGSSKLLLHKKKKRRRKKMSVVAY